MRIAFFDSGIGGITVLNEAINRLPAEDFLYFADTLHVPYGTKSLAEVNRYVKESVEAIMQEEIKALVVACNTATSAAISELRQQYSIPIIGMEPAVKPAVEKSLEAGRRVLVFATPLTLSQAKYTDLVARVDDHSIVDSFPLPELVPYCENLNFDPVEIGQYFRDKLAPLDLSEYGTVVLGCTHYPFYRNLLRQVLPPHIELIDGSAGTVKRLVTMLKERSLLGTQGTGDLKFMCSGSEPDYVVKMKQALAFLRQETPER